MKVLNYNFRFLLAILGGFIIFSGCNKQPESIGLDLVDQNKLPVFDTTVFSFALILLLTIRLLQMKHR